MSQRDDDAFREQTFVKITVSFRIFIYYWYLVTVMGRCCCNILAGFDGNLALKMTRNILNTYMNNWKCVNYLIWAAGGIASHQIGFDCSLGHCLRVPWNSANIINLDCLGKASQSSKWVVEWVFTGLRIFH